jgi:type IV pilus assembly protein PilY1
MADNDPPLAPLRGKEDLRDGNLLAKQTLTNVVTSGVRSRTVSANTPTDLGWYVDFPDNGERSNIDMILAQGTLLIPTNVPTQDGGCEAGGYSWMNFLNYATGSFVTGATNAAIWTGNDLTTGVNVVWIKGVPQVIRTGNNTPPTLLTGLTFSPGNKSGVTGHRVGWREIFPKTK